MLVIDWIGVATNSVWLLGLAGMLAVFSYYGYLAAETHMPLRQMLNSPQFVEAFSWTMVLFCIGVAASDGSWWQRVVWVVLGVLSGIQAWQSRTPPHPKAE